MPVQFIKKTRTSKPDHYVPLSQEAVDKGCKFFANVGVGGNPNAANGGLGTEYGTTTKTIQEFGRSVNTDATAASGIWWESTLQGTGSDVTILIGDYIDLTDQYAHLFAVADDHSGTFGSLYGNSIRILRNSFGTDYTIRKLHGATAYSDVTCDTGFLTVDEYHVYGFNISGTNADFYKDGIKHGTSKTFSSSGIHWNEWGDIDLHNRNHSDPASTIVTDGDANFVIVFGRSLTPAEMKSYSENPWQLLEPERKPFFFVDANVNVAASLDTLTITTYQASAGVAYSINASQTALALTSYQATIAEDVNVTTNTPQALVLTEIQAQAGLGSFISATTQALTLTGQSASITGATDRLVSSIKTELVLRGRRTSIDWTPVISSSPYVKSTVMCPVCGFEKSPGEFRLRWDGVKVCKDDWEPRHPQEFLRGRETPVPQLEGFIEESDNIVEGGTDINGNTIAPTRSGGLEEPKPSGSNFGNGEL